MMDYSKMSDFEINRLVAIAEGLQVQEIDDSKATGMTSKYHELRPHTVWVSDGDNPWEQYAPTLCWEDAGPIIAGNGISLIKCTVGSGYWSAEIITDIDEVTGNLFQCQSSLDAQDASPLRAAMIVFLKMQESANVQGNPA